LAHGPGKNGFERGRGSGKSARRRVHLVHVPGAVQAQILAGCHAITRKHPDWVKLGLTNSLYGGAFNSRLVMNNPRG